MDVPEIDIEELERRLPGGPLLVDVREPEEWVDVRIAGAVHIPLAEVPGRVDELPTTGEVLVICARGGRSFNAARFLRAQGIDAINVAGGTLGWLEAGKPVERGVPGDS